MKIRLQLPGAVKTLLGRLEEYRTTLGVILAVAFLVLLVLGILLRFVSRAELLLDLSAGVLLGGYFYQLRRRNSLKWKSEQLLSTLRTPTDLNLTREMAQLYQFKSFYSVILVCGIIALLFAPNIFGISSFRAFPLSSTLYASAKADFFLALWQVHAAFVGFFLVLLTFVFQFVSVKWAYEANLLPSMAKRAWLSFTLTVNLVSLLYEMIVCLFESAGENIVFLRYCALLTLVFSIVSALFIFLKVREFLRPDSLETCLSEEIQVDLVLAIEDEQRRALSQYLMEEECRMLGLEYSTFALTSGSPSVVTPRSGVVRDVNLARLRQFARGVSAAAPGISGQSPDCTLYQTIGDELRAGVDVLAKVPSKSNSPRNQRLLIKAFRIVSAD